MIELDFIEELNRFNLALKKNSTEVRQGEQTSSHTGNGMVFKDHKRYVAGDDFRSIDWKVYARTGDLYVKRFEEERSITLHILLDRSSSMDFGDPNKYDYAAKIGLATAYMASNTNDRFRFSVFSETVTDISFARRNANLGGLVDTLNNLQKTPESLVERCVNEYSKRIENKSVVIIISDFFTDIDEIENAIGRLKNSEVILVSTLSPQETDPELSGDKILLDPESDSRVRTYFSKRTKSKYQDNLNNHLESIEDLADKTGAEFLQISTGDDIFESFTKVWYAIN